MPTEIISTLVVTEISPDNINWKTVVCETQSKVDSSSSVSDVKTKCGPFSAVTRNVATITGNGVATGNLAPNQLSFHDLLFYQQSMQKIWIRRQNAASGVIPAGQITYLHGQGYVSNVAETAAEGDVVKFDFTLTLTGTVAFVPGS